jgi:cytochrome c biogenesis protein CcdA
VTRDGTQRTCVRAILGAILAALFVVGPAPVQAEEPVARVVYFYSEYCTHCQAVTREVLQPLQERYGPQLEIRSFEVSDQSNYELLLTLEDRYQLPRREIPTVFLGERVLVGEEQIRAEMDRAVENCLTSGGCDFPPLEVQASSSDATAASSAEIHLAYFYTVGCAECDRAKYDLDYVKARFPGLIVTAFDIGAPENKALNEALCGRLGVPENERLLTPAVFVGESYLISHDIDATGLLGVVQKYVATGSPATWADLKDSRAAAEQSIGARFRSFGVAPVLAAGLIDGLNPCAFATMIFFVSYMAVARRRGREILFVGGSFTLGVFLAYLLIGLGFLTAIKSLSFLVTAARAVYIGTAIICFGLAVVSVRDFVRIRRGGLAEMSLQLPAYFKNRIHRVIRERAHVRQFVLAAFASGFIISVLELLCTGQVYLPTIVYVVGVPELRAQATLYLVLYNVMFVVPLVGAFVLTYFGTTSRDFTRFLQQHAATIKLLMAGLFIALGGWLVYAAI